MGSLASLQFKMCSVTPSMLPAFILDLNFDCRTLKYKLHIKSNFFLAISYEQAPFWTFQCEAISAATYVKKNV